jgi:hypothetical protein
LNQDWSNPVLADFKLIVFLLLTDSVNKIN